MRWIWFGALVALVTMPLSCSRTGGMGDVIGESGDDDVVADDDDDDDAGDDDDGAEIVASNPVDGATDVHYRTRIEVTFSEPVEGAFIELEDDGGLVAGVSELDETGTTVTFDPHGDDPQEHLQPLTGYTATVRWSGHDPVELAFTTSEVGTVVSAGDVEGYGYAADLLSGEFVEPPGVGPLLSQYMGDLFPVLWVLDVDDAGHTIEIGLGDGEETDIGTWHNPHMRLGPSDLTFHIEGLEASVSDVYLDGDFLPDGSALVEGGMDGLFDTRFLDILIDPGGSEGAACELMASLGIACVECPSDGDLACLRVVAAGFRAERIDPL